MPAVERFNVSSRGKVDISVQKAGQGPALLLIHGALLDAAIVWAAVLPKLSAHFTVYAMNRRGRTPSGDAEEYSFEEEAGDIVAVVDSIGQPVTILAHSYGALLTLEAIERLKAVSQLILYEPPVTLSPVGRPGSEKILGDMDRALEANDREEVVRVFLRDQIGGPEDRFTAFRSSPIWPRVVEIASTLPRESRAVNSYRPWGERLAKCKIPASMLLGTETTSSELKDGSIFVCQAIPGCRLVMLEGQGHSAMMEAPDLFASTVLEIVQTGPKAQPV